jgi:DNA-binding transcriptional LysR family regulator
MFQSRGLRPAVALEANEMQTAIGLVVAGIGYTLVPQSVQGLHRDGVVYLALSDAGVSSPVIMNRRAGDESELIAQFRAMVQAVSR